MAPHTRPADDRKKQDLMPALCTGSTHDLPALLKIEKICFVGDYARHRFRSSDFSAYLTKPSALFQIAVAGGKPVGYVAGVVRRRSGETNARLDSIAVLPAWRRRGIGGQLLKWFLDASQGRQAKLVKLEVLASNKQGLHWFARAGFQEVWRLPNYYAAGVDGIGMSVTLSEGVD